MINPTKKGERTTQVGFSLTQRINTPQYTDQSDRYLHLSYFLLNTQVENYNGVGKTKDVYQ